MRAIVHRLGAALCVGVAAYALVAYAVLPLGAVLHPALRGSFALHPAAWVYLHVFAAAAALLLGPLQFAASLRARRPRLHRWLGRLYLAVGVGLGGLSGFVLSLNAYGGAASRAGFSLLALLWLASGIVALQRILRGDVAGHRRWMVRNFALACAAVTLRMLLPAAVAGGVAIEVAYPLIAWLCWVPNLVVAEWLLRRDLSRRSPPSTRSAPAARAA